MVIENESQSYMNLSVHMRWPLTISKYGNAIHFYTLTSHYYVSSWIYIAIIRVQKTLKEDMAPIQWDYTSYSWSKEVLEKKMEELLTNGKVLMECLL